ncbi:hypothetical protein TNCV_506801 [Trichonephila clavipes]|nr:hypothetical protein TNCV_506801 [Trichonephila clavipes]
MVARRLTQITPPTTRLDHFWQRVEAAWSAVPQEHIQSLFESMPRRVAAVNFENLAPLVIMALYRSPLTVTLWPSSFLSQKKDSTSP